MKFSFFKHLRRFRYAHKHPLTDPHFAWDLSLGISGVLFIALIIWSYGVFRSVSGEGPSTTIGANAALDTINGDQVREILRYYDAKSQTFEEIKHNPSVTIDPSL